MSCIKYIVKINIPTSTDIKRYIYSNRAYYIYFGMSFFIGLIVGIVLSLTNESFYELLSSNKKLVFSIMNGTADYLSIFWKCLFQVFIPLLILFLLSFNYYLGKLSYLFVLYQSASMVVSYSAIIGSFGFFGILNVLIIMIPVNLIYFLCLFYFGTICRIRSVTIKNLNNILSGLDNEFFIKTVIAFIIIFLLSLFAGVLLPIFFKTFSFIIY